MKNGRAVLFTNQRAKVNLVAATGNLFYLLFGRVPDKLLAFFIFAVFLTTLSIYSIQSSGFKAVFSRTEISSFPTFVKTINSPGSNKLRAEESRQQEIIRAPIIAGYPIVRPAVQKTLDIGDLDYSRKLSVFATSYDKNCPGCSGTTASGLPAGYGVIAVDPRIIPLGTKVYIPGYGVAVAGDTGGSIKGNKIDLGFDNIQSGWWSSRFVDVYILK